MSTAQQGCIRGRIEAPEPCVVQIRWYAVDGRCLGHKRSYAGGWSLRLPAGRYFVEVADERAAADPARFASSTAAVVVRAGYVSEVDIQLTRDTRAPSVGPAAAAPDPTGVLQGRIVDAADPAVPLHDARIRLLDASGQSIGRVRTDAGGRFVFEGLATARRLQLVVRPPAASHTHLRLQVSGLAVTDGDWHDLGDLSLPLAPRPRHAPPGRSASAEFGSSAALSLPATRV